MMCCLTIECDAISLHILQIENVFRNWWRLRFYYYQRVRDLLVNWVQMSELATILAIAFARSICIECPS
jgi:hypothetical protein